MAIQNIPAFPLRSQGLAQQAYSAGVEASLSALPKFVDDMNAVGSAYALTTNGTSSTSVAIGTGSKSFTTQTNLGYLVGMTLRLAFDSTNYMTGDVTSYNTGSGALVVNVTSIIGSGTRTSWVITMAAVGANNASAVSFTPAGNIAATNVQAAIEELDTEKIATTAGAVGNSNLATNSVSTIKIQDSSVTDAKISLGSNSQPVKIALNANNAPPIYAARAWVNFDGTGTVTIRASGNVSSITDNGVGDYTINFTTAMPNANYATVFGGRATVSSIYQNITIDTANAPTTSALRLWTLNASGVKVDSGVDINVAIFA
jgi:hypothetical protein